MPYLTLMREDAPQREYGLRELFNALRYVVKTGCQWRFLPHDFPPWTAVYQQARRWNDARAFEAAAHDLRQLIRLAMNRSSRPTAVIMDGRTLQSTPESGGRAGFDGHQKKHGSKVHAAVDSLGNLLALVATPANEQERAQVATLAREVQQVCASRLRRPRLHWSRRRSSRPGTGDPTGGRQACRGEARIRPSPQTVGRRTNLRLARSISTTRSRLRTTRSNTQSLALGRCTRSGTPKLFLKCITGSRAGNNVMWYGAGYSHPHHTTNGAAHRGASG